MTKIPLLLGCAFVALAAHADAVHAQCAFSHPSKAKTFKTSLVQANVCCTCYGGLYVNGTSQSGIPSCRPPETFNQLFGFPPNGWLWGPKGSGSVVLQAAKNKLEGPFNPFPNTADMAVRVKLSDVRDAQSHADGTGTLVLLFRITFEDRVSGDMTLVDFPLGVAIPVADGKAKVKTSVGSVLNTTYMTSLPGCSSLEVVGVLLLDENTAQFGAAGVYLPDINPN